MAQSTGRDNIGNEPGKGVGAAKRMADRAADMATDAVAQTTEAMNAGTERVLEASRDFAESVRAPMVRLVLDRTAPAMQDMVQAESDLATFWLEMTRDQTQHTIETMQRLAEVREWRDAFEIQSDYFRTSMARMSEALLRQMKLVGSMTKSLMAASRADLRDAA